MTMIRNSHMGLVRDAEVGNGFDMVLLMKPSPVMGLCNAFTDFNFRLGYMMWVLRGANLLKPLDYYGKIMGGFTDDGESLRGAYGPRLRYWVGVDALQEATNINQNLESEKEFVKPSGIDQLEAVFRDLEAGRQYATMVVFDPAIDYEETNYVPDLISITFSVVTESDGRHLDMLLGYNELMVDSYAINDMFLFEMVKVILAGFLKLVPGKTIITSICRSKFSKDVVNDEVEGRYTDPIMADSAVMDMAHDLNDFKSEKFWEEFRTLVEFENHLRLMVNNETFINREVNVTELAQLLEDKLMGKITCNLLRDIGHSIMICAILRYADNFKLYDDYLEVLAKGIKYDWMRFELATYYDMMDKGIDSKLRDALK